MAEIAIILSPLKTMSLYLPRIKTVLSFLFEPSGVIRGSLGNEISEKVKLTFNIQLDPIVYEESDWGEPPQFAIWLEEPETKRGRKWESRSMDSWGEHVLYPFGEQRNYLTTTFKWPKPK